METEKGITHKSHDGGSLSQSEQIVEGTGQVLQAHAARALTQWWFVEIWNENREGFKALIEHVLGFLTLIGSLVSINLIVNLSELSQQRKDLIETIDFYGIVLALGIFSLGFILRLLILILWKSRH